MKTEQELNASILAVTMTIHNKYPELSKYIEEMPVTIPDVQSPEINNKHLENYHNTLVSMVDGYQKKNAPSYIKLFFAILACEGVGLLSGLISGNEVNTWFATLNKPSWNPPAFLFAPVWATLYFLMAISLYIIWTKIKIQPQKNNALILFGVQLTLNFLWSIIFFRFHSPLIALLDIVLLFVAIFITILNFSRYSKLAAWLMVPYFAWVTFATILNFSIWYLNR